MMGVTQCAGSKYSSSKIVLSQTGHEIDHPLYTSSCKVDSPMRMNDLPKITEYCSEGSEILPTG